ncbi:hypothetical protein LLB_2152 [Legionella longbeachae D-4968]|nr:hypothetical protein LLB_2152 [Legionella longbeachae D-4968]
MIPLVLNQIGGQCPLRFFILKNQMRKLKWISTLHFLCKSPK